MQTDAERTLNNLHVLGALSHNDKLMTNEDAFDIYAPTSLRGLLRMWYAEGRVANIARIRQCVRSAINFATKALEDTNAMLDSSQTTSPQSHTSQQMKIRVDTLAVHHIRMLDALSRAKHGLHNLLQTYREDAASASQIQLLVEEIDDYIAVTQAHTERLRETCLSVPASNFLN